MIDVENIIADMKTLARSQAVRYAGSPKLTPEWVAAEIIEQQQTVIASLTLALQKIEQLPPVHGEMEQYRASQEVRLNEQCRFIARDALSKLAEV